MIQSGFVGDQQRRAHGEQPGQGQALRFPAADLPGPPGQQSPGNAHAFQQRAASIRLGLRHAGGWLTRGAA